MKLSIIIVSWNVKEKLRENLEALLKSKTDFDFEIIVVDNNSEDGSALMVEQDFKGVSIVKNEANFGFAKANNIALKQIESKYALLLNPDMKIRFDTIQNMLTWMEENQQASLASCRLLSKEGDIIRHVRRFPQIFDQLLIVLKLPHLFTNILNKYLRVDFDYNKTAQVDSVRGAFFMINLEVARELELFRNSTLPYMDERYFLWFEEVDYCKQVQRGGGEVWYTNVAECVDLIGQSFKQVSRGATQKYMADSMLKYFKKWHSSWQWLLLKLTWPIGKIITGVIDKFGIKPRAKT
ncbi:MAG: glycosyltransferase family 2 protein [Patescibacteria group bacterium]|nr:glycosyltransferase family 2 protein [Patescibacteria group bacterium]